MPKEEKQKEPSIWNKIEGAIEIGAGVALFVNPLAIVAVGAVGCVYMTYKNYKNEPEDSKRTFKERLFGAAGMTFGTLVGSTTLIGAAVVGLIGIKEAWYGNAASFDLIQGAIWGGAVGVGVPAVAAVMIAEGAYKAVTGKDCNVMGYTLDKARSAVNAISDYFGKTQTPSKENVREATVDLVKKGKEGTKDLAYDAIANNTELANDVANAAINRKLITAGGDHKPAKAKDDSFLGRIGWK